ncbi:hypothetical protein CAPTEDRAFT_188705 [Capitella teleta]|uniref:Uncharacterized protein n=1 Tax=Capitella teleta TaxID=283909 RepID=R7T651_CAPTE|nr:hypothetical protein CAPTEDRAFT_188705 [Capitella teleta]|eukprot:ELT88994.1 hypothetical protein CAPTEDRAFT_188705 [Capitella teleta]
MLRIALFISTLFSGGELAGASVETAQCGASPSISIILTHNISLTGSLETDRGAEEPALDMSQRRHSGVSGPDSRLLSPALWMMMSHSLWVLSKFSFAYSVIAIFTMEDIGWMIPFGAAAANEVLSWELSFAGPGAPMVERTLWVLATTSVI